MAAATLDEIKKMAVLLDRACDREELWDEITLQRLLGGRDYLADIADKATNDAEVMALLAEQGPRLAEYAVEDDGRHPIEPTRHGEAIAFRWATGQGSPPMTEGHLK